MPNEGTREFTLITDEMRTTGQRMAKDYSEIRNEIILIREIPNEREMASDSERQQRTRATIFTIICIIKNIHIR